MTFPNAWDLADETELPDSSKEVDPIGSPIGSPMQLTERQTEILFIIKENPRISFEILSKQLNIQEAAIKKHINALKKKGALARIGGTRGYWQIVETYKDN